MSGGARSRVGLDIGQGPSMSFIMYDMWYYGELTKLYAYGFQFMFQVLLVRKGRDQDDRISWSYIGT